MAKEPVVVVAIDTVSCGANGPQQKARAEPALGVTIMTVPNLSAPQDARPCDINQRATSPLAGLNVLVVEDEVVIAEAAMLMLEDAGANPLGPCVSVTSALAMLEENHVDLALLDVDLKGTRSNAVALALAERGIPHVAATGHTVAAALAGAPVIIAKPYAPEQAKAALESALAAHDEERAEL
jgi:CheY-like chemotaxis protein